MSRRCARPGCGQPADTTLSYDYARRLGSVGVTSAEIVIGRAVVEMQIIKPDQPPKGWELRDRRSAAQAAVTLKFAS